jgi:iron-sulfur cluster assembly accessory protein
LDEIISQEGKTVSLGLKIIVDSKALMVLVGTEMDYVEDDIRSEFVFRNPNSKGECGCGESFHI